LNAGQEGAEPYAANDRRPAAATLALGSAGRRAAHHYRGAAGVAAEARDKRSVAGEGSSRRELLSEGPFGTGRSELSPRARSRGEVSCISLQMTQSVEAAGPGGSDGWNAGKGARAGRGAGAEVTPWSKRRGPGARGSSARAARPTQAERARRCILTFTPPWAGLNLIEKASAGQASALGPFGRLDDLDTEAALHDRAHSGSYSFSQ